MELLRNHPCDLNLNLGRARRPPPRFSGSREEADSLRRLLQMPSLWFAAVSYLFIGFTAYLVNLFIVTYGNLELKYPFSQAAQLASGIAFSGIAGAFLLPLLSDYIGRKKCILIINGGMTASILLIIWAGKTWPSLFAAACIFGVFYAAPGRCTRPRRPIFPANTGPCWGSDDFLRISWCWPPLWEDALPIRRNVHVFFPGAIFTAAWQCLLPPVEVLNPNLRCLKFDLVPSL
jgi:MFS family permease